MTDFTTEIDQILEQALTEKTFSLEVVNRIKELKEDYEKLQKKNKVLEELRDTLLEQDRLKSTQLQQLAEERAEQKSKLKKWKERENEIKEREFKIELVNKDYNNQLNRSNEIKELFEIVFRNPIVRTQVQKTIPLITPGSPADAQGYNSRAPYASGSTATETKTTTKEEQ